MIVFPVLSFLCRFAVFLMSKLLACSLTTILSTSSLWLGIFTCCHDYSRQLVRIKLCRLLHMRACWALTLDFYRLFTFALLVEMLWLLSKLMIKYFHKKYGLQHVFQAVKHNECLIVLQCAMTNVHCCTSSIVTGYESNLF